MRFFKDDKDFHDHDFHPPFRGGGLPSGRGAPPPRAGFGAEPRPRGAPRSLHELSPTGLPKASNKTQVLKQSLAKAVGHLNETIVLGRRRADAELIPRHKQLVDRLRREQAISAAVAKHSAQAATSPLRRTAQAIAADRRYYNPTPGPKTTSGTQASIVPTARSRFRFAFPGVAVPCVQRQTRKEVLFALKKTGRGSSHRPKKKGPHSQFGC